MSYLARARLGRSRKGGRAAEAPLGNVDALLRPVHPPIPLGCALINLHPGGWQLVPFPRLACPRID